VLRDGLSIDGSEWAIGGAKEVQFDSSCSQERSILQSIHSPWCSSLMDHSYSTADDQSHVWLCGRPPQILVTLLAY
jgi:hypothetical protein